MNDLFYSKPNHIKLKAGKQLNNFKFFLYTSCNKNRAANHETDPNLSNQVFKDAGSKCELPPPPPNPQPTTVCCYSFVLYQSIHVRACLTYCSTCNLDKWTLLAELKPARTSFRDLVDPGIYCECEACIYVHTSNT